MDVHQLKMFMAVVEDGSIRRAAVRTYVAQPQLSQVIRRLEREIGAPLLFRSAKGVEPTAAGRELFEQARHLVRDFDRSVERVRNVAESNRVIVVGLLAGEMAAGELTSPILVAFCEANPDISVKIRELNFDEQSSALTNGDVDVALVRLPVTDERLETRPLHAEPRVLCVGRRHPLADAASIRAEEILGETMIDLAGCSQAWTDFWQLNDLRGEPARTCGKSISTVGELKFTLLLEQVVMPIARSTWDMGLADPALCAVPLEGAAWSEIAVAYRGSDTRNDVMAFASCAEKVSRSSRRSAEAVLAGA